MTKLTRWRPFAGPSLLSDFPRSFEELFRLGLDDDMFPRFAAGDGESEWSPRLNVVETPEGYEIEAEVAGVNPEEIRVTLTNDRLTISGERRHEERREEDHLHVVERSYGSFSRSMTFPNPVDSDAVSAEAKDGVLTIRVKKSTESLPRQIEIKTK